MKEMWRPIRGYEDLYEVSNLGRVKALSREVTCSHEGVQYSRSHKGRILKSRVIGKRNYIILWRSIDDHVQIRVDKLVASAWVDNPNNFSVVSHIDSDKLNDCAHNLRWSEFESKHEITSTEEEWRPVPIDGYEDLYEVSNTGRVRSIHRLISRNSSKGFSYNADFVAKEIKPFCVLKKSGLVKYHLHKRYRKGYYGQTDIYVFAEQLVRDAFPELYVKE